MCPQKISRYYYILLKKWERMKITTEFMNMNLEIIAFTYARPNCIDDFLKEHKKKKSFYSRAEGGNKFRPLTRKKRLRSNKRRRERGRAKGGNTVRGS